MRRIFPPESRPESFFPSSVFSKRNVTRDETVMEGIFPCNAYLKIIVRTWPTRTIYKVALIRENGHQLEDSEPGHLRAIVSDGRGTFRLISAIAKVWKQFCPEDCLFVLITELYVVLKFIANYISMLKRSLSMEFDSDHFKSSVTQNLDTSHIADLAGAENESNSQSSKKICHSPEKTTYEDGDAPNGGRWTKSRKLDTLSRFAQNAENVHVTQSKSIFSHENSCIYGNPKDDIKNIENPEALKEMPLFDGDSVSALDLSCKSIKGEESKSSDGNTYQNYPKSNSSSENPFPRSNLQIKLVSPTHKKPSIPEQLQIAKMQQQQRRSIQQQQKLIQQMRRSLDPTGKTSSRSHHSNNTESGQGSHKNVKHFSNSAPAQEQKDLDYQGRMKEEHQTPLPSPHFLQYPYFEPGQHKELPDGHPILPLLDPVYFSALYNAHGFFPPSSPSIAAAFIGTLQDALPKLPIMFPSTSSHGSSALPQKNNDNHN